MTSEPTLLQKLLAGREEQEQKREQLEKLLLYALDSDEERVGGQMMDLAEAIFEGIEAQAAEDTNGNKSKEVLNGLGLLKHIQEATNPISGYSPNMRAGEIAQEKSRGHLPPDMNDVWYHKDIDAAFSEGEKYKKHVVVEQHELGKCVFYYLRQRWACVSLERLMLDALVFAEVDGFGVLIREQIPTTWKSVLFRGVKRWLWLALVSGLCGVGIADRWGFWPGVVLAIVIYHLMILAYAASDFHITTERMRILRLHGGMAALYKSLAEPNWSPAYLADQVSSLAGQGAVWKPAIAALIENAVRRNPVAWEMPPTNAGR